MRRLTIIIIMVVSAFTSNAQTNNEEDFAMLSAYRDYFSQATDFSLSFARYRTRGYENNLRKMSWNDIPLENWENGTVSWAVLGNLSKLNLDQSSKDNISTAFWPRNRAWSIGGSVSNRTYTHSLNAGYSATVGNRTGFLIDISKKWGESMSIKGVSADAYSFFASISHELKNGHKFELSMLYAPSDRSTQRASTAEAYELMGDNLYNPAWGWQGSAKRNVRQNYTSQPIIMLNHSAPVNEKIRIHSTLAARFGSEYRSALSWQNAPNPYPDYYRYMPSYQTDPAEQDIIRQSWLNGSASELNFQNMYDINGYNAPQAKYIMEQRWRDVKQFFVASKIVGGDLSGGFELSYAANRNYKKVADLMGADYWLDIDAFVENDDDVKDQAQNNVRNPNNQAREGDVFGYDYSMTMKRAKAHAVYQKQWGEYGFRTTGEIMAVEYQREGHFEKENFDGDASYGKSPRVLNYEYGLNVEGWYQQGGRLRVAVTGSYRTVSPSPSQLFVSREYRNATVPRSVSEKVASVELRADYRQSDLRISGTLYLTSVSDKTQLLNFYDDNIYQYAHYWLQGISQRYAGLELSVEVNLYENLKGKLALAFSDNHYTSNPRATQWRESTGEELRSDETVYYENLRVSGSPQNVVVASLEYTPRQYVVSFTANYFDDNYIALSPLRRTERSSSGISRISQEKLSGGVTLDLFGGRNFYFRNNHAVGVWVGINNVLNNKDLRTGGFESFRTSASAASDSRYYYALGINGFVSVTYKF